jgi:hypothetical protein
MSATSTADQTMPAHGVGIAEAFEVRLRIALRPAEQIAAMHRITCSLAAVVSQLAFGVVS